MIIAYLLLCPTGGATHTPSHHVTETQPILQASCHLNGPSLILGSSLAPHRGFQAKALELRFQQLNDCKDEPNIKITKSLKVQNVNTFRKALVNQPIDRMMGLPHKATGSS